MLGVVASSLKLDGQDLPCAKLNMASRALRAETLRTLWDTVLIPRFSGDDPSAYHAHEQFLQRLMNAKGAKFNRYVDCHYPVFFANKESRIRE